MFLEHLLALNWHLTGFFFFPFKASFTEDFSVSNNVVFQIWQVIDSDLMFVVIIVQHKSLLNYILHL